MSFVDSQRIFPGGKDGLFCMPMFNHNAISYSSLLSSSFYHPEGNSQSARIRI